MPSPIGWNNDHKWVIEGIKSLEWPTPTLAVKPMATFWSRQLSKTMLTRGNTILARNNDRVALFVVCGVKESTSNEKDLSDPYQQQATRAGDCSLDILLHRPTWREFAISKDPTKIMVVNILNPELRRAKTWLQDLVEERLRRHTFPNWVPHRSRVWLPGWYQEDVSWERLQRHAIPLSTVDITKFEAYMHPHDLVLYKVLHNNTCQSQSCVDRYDARSREELYNLLPGLRLEVKRRIGAAELNLLMTNTTNLNFPAPCVHCFGIGAMYDEIFRITPIEVFTGSSFELDFVGRILHSHLSLIRRLRREYGYSTHVGQFYARGDCLLGGNGRLYGLPPKTTIQPDIKRVLAMYQSMEFWRMTEPSHPGWNEMCAICREEYTSVAMIVRLQCGHHFHERCLADWFTEIIKCPMCQGKVPGGEVEVQPPVKLIGTHDEYIGFIDSP